MAAIQLFLFAGDLVVAGDLVRTPHGWCFFWPIGAASAFCVAIFLQSAQPWRRFGSTTLNEACVFSGRASESATCTFVATKVVSGMMFFFFLSHRATVDGVSSGPSVRRPLSASQFFSKAHNRGAGLAAPL